MFTTNDRIHCRVIDQLTFNIRNVNTTYKYQMADILLIRRKILINQASKPQNHKDGHGYQENL